MARTSAATARGLTVAIVFLGGFSAVSQAGCGSDEEAPQRTGPVPVGVPTVTEETAP